MGIESRAEAQQRAEEDGESPCNSANVFQIAGLIKLGESCPDKVMDDNHLLESGNTSSKESVADVSFSEDMHIKDMLDVEVIRESKLPYTSPVTIVSKKDGTNRICVEYRKLNCLTDIDPTPMPNPHKIFQKMSKANFFTKQTLAKDIGKSR